MSKTTDGYVPEPMTCHPHYASQADAIRGGLESAGYSLRVAEATRPLFASFHAEPPPVAEASFQTRVLDIKKAAGPAPFVGDPREYSGRYVWKAAVDDLGRHVAGEAALEIVRDPKY